MSVSEAGVRERPNATWVLKHFPLSIYTDIETEELFGGGKDSSQILVGDLEQIIRAAKRSFDDKRVPMITHGTDSLATTGMVLSQVFPDRLIVLTAAFRPIADPDSDAAANVQAAVMIASTIDDPRIPKVPYAVMNGQVFLASSLVKLDTEFRGKRRGFKSYRGTVGTIVDQKIEWSPEFLSKFDETRQSALRTTFGLRAAIQQQLNAGTFALGNIEIAYVNEFTPDTYVNSMLDRLASGDSDALILSGLLGDNAAVIERINQLAKRGLAVYIEHATNKTSSGLRGKIEPWLVPSGLQPSQLWSKAAVFAKVVVNPRQSRDVMAVNQAGEIYEKPDVSYVPEVILSNFYERPDMARGFLIYFQNAPLFKKSVAAELARLRRRNAAVARVELVIEGLGDGHVYVGGDAGGSAVPPMSKPSSKLIAVAPMPVSLLAMLKTATATGIAVTVLASPRDAAPSLNYEVGRTLQAAGVHLARETGRRHLSLPHSR